MDVTEKLRNVMEKVEPWQWVAGVIVAGLGIYAWSRSSGQGESAESSGQSINPSSLFTQSDSSGGGGGSGGNITDSQTASNESAMTAVVNAISAQTDSFTRAFNNVTGAVQSNDLIVNNSIAKLNENVATLIAEQAKGDIKPTPVKEVPQPVGTITPTGGGVSAVAEKPAMSIAEYVAEEKRVESVYNARVAAGQDVTAQIAYAQKIQANAPINLGNNGIGYVPEKAAETIKQVTSSIPAYIAETQRVETVIANRAANGMDTTKQVAYAQTIQAQAPINLGNNGIGYDAAKSNAFEASLKTNQSAYNTEIKRVNEVIANRKAAGLDITNQVNYLNKIKQ